jgi:hypothetical protein
MSGGLWLTQVPLYVGVPCVLAPTVNRITLTVFLRKACKDAQETGGSRAGNLRGEEIHIFHPISNIINVIKSQV